MNLAVKLGEETIGTCRVEDLGLYWELHCSCHWSSDQVERLYWREHRLGVLERERDQLIMNRRIPKSKLPGFPEKDEPLHLHACRTVLGCHLPPAREENGKLWYPWREDAPFPCMPLACLFSVEETNRGYYWTLAWDLA